MEKILSINENGIREELGELVRGTIEQTLNTLLDQEAEQLCGAGKYERNQARQDYRSGHYTRGLHTKAGQVTLKIPKLRKMTFETAIIERYRRRESSIEEAMIEMYLAGISVRRMEDVTEALWGTKVSPATISEMNKKVYGSIEAWRNRPLTSDYPYVHLDGVFLKRSFAGEVINVSILVAIGVNSDGYREILGAMEGTKEDGPSWRNFLCHLKERGLRGVRLFVSDKHMGFLDAVQDVFPEVGWQRCMVHFFRNVASSVPHSKVREVMSMLKAIHAQESRDEAKAKAQMVISRLKEMRLTEAAKRVESGIDETLEYTKYPSEHWRRIRTNNGIERINREIRRRTRVVGSFPDGNSALMLVCARLRYVASKEWGTKRYLNMKLLDPIYSQQQAA